MKQFKKVLAFVLALAMVVTAVPTADAKAAAKQPKLNNTKKILYVGQSYTLKIGNLPANWKKCTYAWSASNKNVTVKKGKYGQAASVKANKAGTATVTVKMTYPQTAAQKKANKKTVKTFKCVVTVKTPSVKFVTTQAEVEVGTTAQFKATAVPSNATITYASSDKAVATVDANGVVTGVADGEAVISASIKTGAKTTTAKTTVKVFTAASTIKQIGAKKVEITLGKAATAETAVSVKKGAVTVSLADKDGKVLSSDGKTLVLTTNANITADKYTVVVGEETLEFTGEASKVTTIEIPSDKAVLDKNTTIGAATGLIENAVTSKATATYVVKNQFGEDVTATTTVTTSDTNITALKGTITFAQGAVAGKRVNELIAAVLIEQNSGVTASKTFTISNKAAIAEVEIKGVYNKDGKTLTEDTKLGTDKFFLLVAAKDQYGNAVTTASTNELIVSIGGLTKTTVEPTGAKQTKDGVDYLALQIKANGTVTAGTENVIIIPTASGKTATGSYTVADGAKVDTFDITVPELVVANEETVFPFTATDTYGKEITDADVLDNIQLPAYFNFRKTKDGKAELVFNGKYYDASVDYSTVTNDTLVSALFITKTNKVVNKTFTLKPNAKATAITGISSDVALGVVSKSGEKVEIPFSKIKIEDQYGRVMEAKNITGSVKAVTEVADDTDDEYFDTSSATVVADYNATEEKLIFPVVAAKSGSQQYTLELYSGNTSNQVKATNATNTYVANGDFTFTLTSTPATDIKSYEVEDVKPVYVKDTSGTPSGWEQDVVVKGVLADGTKVVVPVSEYTVVTTGTDLKSTRDTGKNIIKVAGDVITSGALKDANEATQSITIAINDKNATEIKKDVKISKEAPKAVSARIDGKDFVQIDGATLDMDELVGLTANKIKVTDQYGKEVDLAITSGELGENARLSITDYDTTNITVTDNGTKGVGATAQSGYYTATAKITFASGVAFSFKVVINN